jgi:outer membrane protein assembly factor BamB
MRNALITLVILLTISSETSCNKGDDPTPTPTPTPVPTPTPTPQKSSDKTIVSFGFKIEDNPGLLVADQNATVGPDTVSITLPFRSQVILRPRIVIKGLSVSPSTLSQQDFTYLVTYIVTAEDGTTKKYIVVVSKTFASGTDGIIYFGSADNFNLGSFYALDANTGKQVWATSLGKVSSDCSFNAGNIYGGVGFKV